MVYFKQHFESCNREWVNFGAYTDFDIQPEGDILCVVRSIIYKGEDEHLARDVYREYVEMDETTIIEKEEYDELINSWNKVSKLYSKADNIMQEILNKCRTSAKSTFV